MSDIQNESWRARQGAGTFFSNLHQYQNNSFEAKGPSFVRTWNMKEHLERSASCVTYATAF